MNQEVVLFNVVLKCKYKEVYKVKGEEERGYGFTMVEKEEEREERKGNSASDYFIPFVIGRPNYFKPR
jgi:hypothetical protein